MSKNSAARSRRREILLIEEQRPARAPISGVRVMSRRSPSTGPWSSEAGAREEETMNKSENDASTQLHLPRAAVTGR